MNKFLPLFLFVLFAGSVFAVDRSPTYDYANGKFNLTCFNSPFYDVNNRSYSFGPSGNQYCTTANNISTTEFPLNSTPRYILAWINLNSENAAGQAYDIFNMGYNFSMGNGIEYKVEFNNTRCLRTQIIQNGTFNTGAFSCGFQNKTWIPVMLGYNGSSCIGYINSSANVSLNQSCSGAYLAAGANATLADRLFGEGVGGGGANGMWNGTMKYVQLYNRTVSGAEFDNYIRNNTISSTGLVFSFSFENTTSTNLTVNLSQLVRSTTPLIGVHSGTTPISSPTWCYNTDYAVCQYSEAQTYFKQSNLGISGFYRKPIDFSNVVASYSGTTGNATWNVITGTGQNYKNINIHRNLLSWAVNNSEYVMFNIDDIPTQLADNDSECNYGVASTGPSLSAAENQAACDPTSYSVFNHLVAQFLVDVGCFNYTSGVCALEGYNEYYLRQFYNTNATAVPDSGVCPTRITKVLNYWNNSGKSQWRAELTAMGYNPNWIRWYGSPAFTYESSTCGAAMGDAWSGNFTKGSSRDADYFIEHTYTSQCSPPGSNGLTTSDDANQQSANIGGYNTSWGVTEGNIICSSLNSNTNNNSQYGSYLAQDWLYSTKNTNRSFNTIFKDTSVNTAANESQNYIVFRGSNLTTTGTPFLSGAYYLLNATKYFQESLPLYNCTSSVSASADCIYQKVNSTNGLLFAVSKLNNQLDIDNISISGFNISSTTDLVASASVTVSGGKADPGYLGIYEIKIFNITSNATPLSATFNPTTYIVNISENSSQTFNITAITNPDAQTYNIVWKNTTGGSSILHCLNQTSCTQIGNYTSAGQYNWSVDIIGETNTVTKVWLLQINDTPQNISFNSTSPSGTVASITLSNSQLFSFVLNNPGSITYAASWLVNGTNQTGSYNSSTFTASGLSLGSYNVTLQVRSNTNNLTQTWTLTVIQGSAEMCTNIMGGLNTIATTLGTLFAIGIMMFVAYLVVAFKSGAGININFGQIDFSSAFQSLFGTAFGWAILTLVLTVVVAIVAGLSGICI